MIAILQAYRQSFELTCLPIRWLRMKSTYHRLYIHRLQSKFFTDTDGLIINKHDHLAKLHVYIEPEFSSATILQKWAVSTPAGGTPKRNVTPNCFHLERRYFWYF